MPVLRPGNVVLFQAPAGTREEGVEVGMILSIWRGIKKPKVYANSCSINACWAFRAVVLDMEEESPDSWHESFVQWKCQWNMCQTLSNYINL